MTRMYSLGSGGYSSCPRGASWVSATAPCTPDPAGGPSDTAFYWSGSAAEGSGALLLTSSAGLTYVSDRYSSASSAASLAAGTSLSTSVGGVAALPVGNSAFSMSAWV